MRAKNQSERGPEVALPRMTVLLVSDDPSGLHELSELARSAGFLAVERSVLPRDESALWADVLVVFCSDLLQVERVSKGDVGWPKRRVIVLAAHLSPTLLSPDGVVNLQQPVNLKSIVEAVQLLVSKEGHLP